MDVKGLELLRSGLRRDLKVLRRNPTADLGRIAEMETSVTNVGRLIAVLRNS